MKKMSDRIKTKSSNCTGELVELEDELFFLLEDNFGEQFSSSPADDSASPSPPAEEQLSPSTSTPELVECSEH